MTDESTPDDNDSTNDEQTQEQCSNDIALGQPLNSETDDDARVGLDVDVSISEAKLALLLEQVAPGLSESERREVAQLLDERETEIFTRIEALLSEHQHQPADPDEDDDHSHPEPTGLTESQRNEVIELINERTPDTGYGDGEYGGGGYGGEIDDLKARLEAMLARLDASMRDLEKSLSRVVGPSPSELNGKFHSTSGWGIHFETQYPVRFISATVVAFKSGYVNFEVHRYDHVEKESLGVVSSTEVGISGEGEHDIDLHLSVDEPGHYVITRDHSDSPADDDRVALRRTDTDYTGWTTDSGDGLTFHGGVDVAGRWGPNQLWYYLADLHVRDDIPTVR